MCGGKRKRVCDAKTLCAHVGVLLFPEWQKDKQFPVVQAATPTGSYQRLCVLIKVLAWLLQLSDVFTSVKK